MTFHVVGYKRVTIAVAMTASAVFAGHGVKAESFADSFTDAIGKTKPLLDMRLRYENVDQTPIADDADAVTLRTRAGFETGKAWDTSLLAEAEWVLPIGTGYNSTINGKTFHPTVADPKAIGLNRLQLTNTSLPATTITFGRQRINLDDQRFVGNVGWRQNEQTYDAVRVFNKSIPSFTVDATYLDRVNRVFGNFSPQGHYNGDTFLVNTAYDFGLGKLTGFAYLLQFDQVAARTDSSQTFGLRFAGSKTYAGVKWAYTASYAKQKDYRNNPLNYHTDYYMAELTGTYQQFSAGAGYEVMGGTGTKGFTTPLATLHKFDGWADKFLTTPVNGVNDLYFNAGYADKNIGPFSTVSAQMVYHRFTADHISSHYGDEIGAQLQGKWQKYTFTLKFADYNADRLFTDTRKIWAQVEYAF